MKSSQKNFRLSKESAALLQQVRKSTGLSETAVVECCLAKHAIVIGEGVELAKKAFLDHVAEVVVNEDCQPVSSATDKARSAMKAACSGSTGDEASSTGQTPRIRPTAPESQAPSSAQKLRGRR